MAGPYYDGKIETLDEWNAILGQCCCQMPECPEPTVEVESLQGFVDLAWQIYNIPTDTYFQTKRQDYGDGGYKINGFSQSWNSTLGGDAISTATPTYSEAPPFTGGSTIDYLDPINEADARSAGFASLSGAVAWDDEDKTYGSLTSALYEEVDPQQLSDTVLRARWVRMRWTIPESWDGTYFRIEWDEVFFPTSGSPTVSAKSWEWTGGEKASDWHVTAPNADGGETEIRNARYICYHGERYGVAPQIHDEFESYEPPS